MRRDEQQDEETAVERSENHEHHEHHEHEHGQHQHVSPHQHGPGEAVPPGMSAEEYWEDRYRSTERVWSGRPNAALVDVVTPLAPGTALDLGCGEGGDALWLARQGWQVTAVDISATALARVAELARDAGVGDRVSVERHDLAESFPAGRFDLVSAQFLQSPLEFPRGQVLRAAAGAVAPGGVLLVVAHAEAPPWSPHAGADFSPYQPEAQLAELRLADGEWEVQRAGTFSRPAVGPDGQEGTLVDSVLVARRR